MVDIWQVEYKLYIKFACTYLREYNAKPDTTQHGFLMTVYSSDLKDWALSHIKMLTEKAKKVRDGRQIDQDVIDEIKSLPGYGQLVELMKG